MGKKAEQRKKRIGILLTVGKNEAKKEELVSLRKRIPPRPWVKGADKKFKVSRPVYNARPPTVGVPTDVSAGLYIKHASEQFEVDFIEPKEITEDRLAANDVNFMLIYDLLEAFHTDRSKNKKVFENLKSVLGRAKNVFPNLSFQEFVNSKLSYYNYFTSKNLPIAPTVTLSKEEWAKEVAKATKKAEKKGIEFVELDLEAMKRKRPKAPSPTAAPSSEAAPAEEQTQSQREGAEDAKKEGAEDAKQEGAEDAKQEGAEDAKKEPASAKKKEEGEQQTTEAEGEKPAPKPEPEVEEGPPPFCPERAVAVALLEKLQSMWPKFIAKPVYGQESKDCKSFQEGRGKRQEDRFVKYVKTAIEKYPGLIFQKFVDGFGNTKESPELRMYYIAGEYQFTVVATKQKIYTLKEEGGQLRLPAEVDLVKMKEIARKVIQEMPPIILEHDGESKTLPPLLTRVDMGCMVEGKFEPWINEIEFVPSLYVEDHCHPIDGAIGKEMMNICDRYLGLGPDDLAETMKMSIDLPESTQLTKTKNATPKRASPTNNTPRPTKKRKIQTPPLSVSKLQLSRKVSPQINKIEEKPQ